jgi:SPP1 gp7 family putative phage head morphogenesis protein
MMVALRAQFEQQRTDILNAASTKAFRAKGYPAVKVTKADKRDYLAALVAWANYNKSMAAALAPILFALINETGKQAMSDLNLDPSMFDPTSKEVLDYYQERADKIATDVNAETEKQLRATLSQGIDAGEADGELQARIENVMGQALTYRTDRIARTEVTRAQGFADDESWSQSGVVTGKEWYTIQDERTCPFCKSQDGRIVSLKSDFYSLGDVVHADGRSLNIGYDDVETPPLHANCRCRTLPVSVPLDASM